jgi:oxygen-independent coproporphyrinogen III oxidase
MATLTVIKNPDPVEYREDGAFVFHHPPKFMWEHDIVPPPQRWTRYSIYLHVPFCRKICTFCTFERKRIRRGAMEAFVEHLWGEMDIVQARDDFSEARIHSVYLGGGTASLMPNEAIVAFLGRLRDEFGLPDGVEVTLESEPGTKTEADLAELRAAGVNRISIGIQAFQDPILKTLNRSHDTAQAIEAVETAKAAGFENVHIDVMYALPGQTMEMWEETVEWCRKLDVPHLSMYQLIVFASETLGRMIHTGEAEPTPPFEVVHDMRKHAVAEFAASGLERYSLTEFSRPGFECDYVRTTWDGSDYLGLGPAAYSRNGHWVWENELIHLAYHEKVEAGIRPVGRGIEMTPLECLERDVAMGLCLLDVDRAGLEERSGVSLDELEVELADLEKGGLIERNDGHVVLTDRGIRYSTEVAKRFTTR